IYFLFIFFIFCLFSHCTAVLYHIKQKSTRCKSDAFVSVKATGFEPAGSASRTQRTTKLSDASISASRKQRLQGILYALSHTLSILNFKFFSIFSLNSQGG